jgi:D-alanyl-D-alanine carboxypeptidase
MKNNPHGLSDPLNYSTTYDLAKLCTKAFKNQIFRSIVK